MRAPPAARRDTAALSVHPAPARAKVRDSTAAIRHLSTKLYKELITRQTSVTDITIRETVTKAYLGALIALKGKSILDENIRTLTRITGDTRAVYDQGFIEQIDVDRLDLSLSTLQTQSDNMGQMQEVTYNVLKMQMGYPLQNTIQRNENNKLA